MKKALKVVAVVTLVYVALMAILAVLTPTLVPIEEEDYDFDDFYDKEIDEYEDERDLGSDCADDITV